MTPPETVYVKLHIGLPMNKGFVEISSLCDYIRAQGGYQVEPLTPLRWELMPDGSTKRSRDQEVAIYTFLVPQNARTKITAQVRQDGYHVIDVFPED